ncbi:MULTISPECIES: hypothetical protein [unclassified Sphingomonas]|uniref:hypothetical protein n=1 Tax=unclassified Sphingomonas TaxID=196159 RepID=UPI000AAA1C59|nr:MULTISPECIES: hypothetical protein [unclassified Sphingomonas]
MTRRAKIGSAIFALLVLACLVVALASRTQRPSVKALYDRSVLFLTGNDPLTRCWKRERDGSFEFDAFIGARRCYDFAPPKSYDGIYIDEFEGQRFVPQERLNGRYDQVPRIWFSMDERSDLRIEPLVGMQRTDKGDGRTRVWRVRFVGREPKRTGRYGHMGMSRRMVLIDRLVSADQLATYDGYLPDAFDLRTINSGNRR